MLVAFNRFKGFLPCLVCEGARQKNVVSGERVVSGEWR